MSHFFSELFLLFVKFGLFALLIFTFFALVSIARKKNLSRVSFIDMKKLSESNRSSFSASSLGDNESLVSKKNKKVKTDKVKTDKAVSSPLPNVFVVDFEGGVDAKTETGFMEEMDAVIDSATQGDKLVIRLKSGGGYVFAYGLAAEKISYAKSIGIDVTVTVDEIAASGGYMMASVANKIIAAPFSIIGSIGVVSGQMNFFELMKKNGISYELFTAGKHKRNITPFTEVEEEHRKKMNEDMANTHKLFIDHIKKHRNIDDIESIANGDVWYGSEALSNGLVDEIGTSWEHLSSEAKSHNIYLVQNKPKQRMKDKISDIFSASITKSYQSISKISIDSKNSRF